MIANIFIARITSGYWPSLLEIFNAAKPLVIFFIMSTFAQCENVIWFFVIKNLNYFFFENWRAPSETRQNRPL